MPTTNYAKQYSKQLKRISQLRDKVRRANLSLYEEINEIAQKNDIPDYVWRDLGLAFYHIDQFDLAEEAMLKAVEAAKKLEGDERKYLSPTYGDLSMIYAAKEEYTKAAEAMRESYNIRVSIYGKDHKLSVSTKKRLDKLTQLSEAIKQKQR